MNKLKEILSKFLPNVPYGKRLHFIAGALIAILGGVIIDPTIKSICDKLRKPQ